jgi:hypothetical protein
LTVTATSADAYIFLIVGLGRRSEVVYGCDELNLVSVIRGKCILYMQHEFSEKELQLYGKRIHALHEFADGM